MKIGLISPSVNISNCGLRTISAYLKLHGFEVKTLFLPIGRLWDDYPRLYSEKALKNVTDVLSQVDIVGISVVSNYFETAIQLTKYIKNRLNIPVLWGGIHPTVKPIESLEFSDMICLGEGEIALLELAKKMKTGQNYHDTKNMWFKANGSIIKNDIRPLVEDIDTLPFQDYDINDHYILVDEKLCKLTPQVLREALPHHLGPRHGSLITYSTLCTRGCPHQCAYCCNSALRMLYRGKGRYVRRRSVENIINELALIKKEFDFIESINFFDDTFLAAEADEIKEFSVQYKSTVGLPFHCFVSPLTVDEIKLSYLMDAGLVFIGMGIQTGSETLNKNIYNRNVTNEQVLRATRIINKFSEKMLPPGYDIIVDSPFEKNSDLIHTLQLLHKIPKPYRLRIFSMVLFPGTELYYKAKAEKYITDDIKEIYRNNFGIIKQPNYLKFLIILERLPFPWRIPNFFYSKQMVALLNHQAFSCFYKFFENIYHKIVAFFYSHKSLTLGIYLCLKRIHNLKKAKISKHES